VTEARRIRENVRKQANYLSHRRIDLDEFGLRVRKQLSELKDRIKMARNAAESIKISITNQVSMSAVKLLEMKKFLQTHPPITKANMFRP
jgi:hypothetical protein